MEIKSENLKKHVVTLCNDYGVRLAGSAAEKNAEIYCAELMKSYGLKSEIEEFPLMERRVESEVLEIKINGKWVKFPASLFGMAPSTNGKVVEAELVVHDTMSGYRKKDLSYLTGKAVIHLGCHWEDPENYERLMKADPAFLLCVDVRYPGNLPLADGLFPAYVKMYGAKPTMNIAYADALSWLRNGAEKARLCVKGGAVPSISGNVVTTIQGTDPDAGIVYVGGHIDTQAGTVGADDNAIGTAAVLEIARALSKEKHRRTIKLIIFGAEEQLSVGSACYIRKHRKEVEKYGTFMVNYDSFGAAMGWTNLMCTGAKNTMKNIDQTFQKHDVYAVIDQTYSPYIDNFSFNVCGVPSVWVYRSNCTAGLFYHHRADNTPDQLCYETSAKHVEAGLELVRYYADSPRPADALRKIPAKMKAGIDQMWIDVYGGWKPAK